MAAIKTLYRWHLSSDKIIQLGLKEWIDVFLFLTLLIAKSLAKINQLGVKVVLKRIVHFRQCFLPWRIDKIADFHTCQSEFSAVKAVPRKVPLVTPLDSILMRIAEHSKTSLVRKLTTAMLLSVAHGSAKSHLLLVRRSSCPVVWLLVRWNEDCR